MTIVARFGIQGCPMLMADLLVSDDGPWALPAPIPTVDDISKAFPARSRCVPSGMCQKLVVLSESFVLGWSGELQVAKEVISEVRRMNAVIPFTAETLIKHFDSLGDSVWEKIGIAGFIEDATNNIQAFNCEKATTFKTALLDDVALLGSGTESVRRELQGFTTLPVTLGGTSNVVNKAVGYGLTLSGSLLNIEIATLENLKDFYGGGYEISTVLNKKFAKVDDITYLFWQTGIDGKGDFGISRIPVRAFRYSYHNDILLIRSVKFQDKGDTGSMGQQFFAVPPIYRNPDRRELDGVTWASLNARFLCNYFMVPMAPKGVAVLAAVTFKDRVEDEKWIKFVETPTVVHVWVEGQFILDMAKEIADMLRSG